MIFRQLYEPVSSTYTYLIGCPETGEAALIDPVLPAWRRDLEVISDLELRLVMTIDTHIHADHITSALQLKREVGSRIATPGLDGLPCADVAMDDGVPLQIGSLQLLPLHTPGHTDNHFSVLTGDRVFTGDALLIDGCGRTDFQSGDARTLYSSVRDMLFRLSGETLVYPAHDYKQRRVSTIAQERNRNPRLGDDRTLEEFLEIMAGLGLPYPEFMDYAIPANRQCGRCPELLPPHLEKYREQMQPNRQG
ncbi:Zn-dependent hydrolase [Lysobacter arseniciresistens ZS79]|uniref:Zn-dependent hydrolase n=1 Tax=Lysobacter arseniciresistens ZS79 TaxID=913325 RepID=A0A0A0F0V1_9GAMM|nr:MBL fold metallo-hydrolase [Lysobacter arseniciresistens]KGM56796.1 Zn-dependent hydrolase [Lysobacter arseniciresistens ZS79]